MASDRSDSGAMLALLRASASVRDGRWINGAPTHVLAELLAALEVDGWVLSKLPCPECHGYGTVQKIEAGDYGNGQGWGNLTFSPCPRGCMPVATQL